MHRRKAKGKRQKARAGRCPGLSFFLFPFSFFLLTLAAGCAQDNRTAAGDPILGGGAAPPGGRTALPPPNPRPQSPAPPPASPASMTSNAALAASTPATFDHNHDLHISSPSAPDPDSG